jgi:RimJ/RimL family protein N-acetyltransferase
MLTGTLVRLRAIDMTDLDRYVEWINDPEVTQYIGVTVPVMPKLAEAEFLEKHAKHAFSFGDFTFAIDTLEGRHIGSISIHEPDAMARKAVLGIMIGDKTCWDRGYGTDAIRTLLCYMFDEMNLHRVSLTVNADNARGIACYRKCGFVEEGRLRDDSFTGGAYHDTLLMSILEPEYRARAQAGAST